jgi:acetyl-CoA C-acetyltransferase
MGHGIQVGVVGSAVVAPRDPTGASLEEALHQVTHAALRDAGIAIEDIDGIVVAGNDQLDGRAITVMMASGSVGGVSRDILATPSSAEHAFVLGSLRVRSGMYNTQLVVSWSPLETEDITEVQRLSADPYYHRALPLDELSAHALQAVALENQVPGLREAAVAVTQTNRLHGSRAYPEFAPSPRESVMIQGGRMLRYPITEGMVSKPAFAVVAMVLASNEWIDQHPGRHTAWVRGMGWATETAWLGDRNLTTLPSLQAAAQQAYTEAGISAPSKAFDVAEVADATAYQQLLALEGLGLCPRTNWVDAVARGTFSAEGSLPVNLSGGALSFNPLFCAGLLRINEAANQVRGRAGTHQRPQVRNAVAHGASGPAMQYNTVVVFGHQAAETAQ